jgi:hypothetical protein
LSGHLVGELLIYGPGDVEAHEGTVSCTSSSHLQNSLNKRMVGSMSWTLDDSFLPKLQILQGTPFIQHLFFFLLADLDMISLKKKKSEDYHPRGVFFKFLRPGKRAVVLSFAR